MDETKLAEWEQLAEKATEAPWTYDREETAIWSGDPDSVLGTWVLEKTYYVTDEDLDFVAAARTAVPELCAEVRRQADQIAMIRDALREIRDAARTGLKPDILNYTDLEWAQHKVNRCARLADEALDIHA